MKAEATTAAPRWDADDYARHSQGQLAWALAGVDRARLAPHEHVLDIGCGDGKVSVEIARRVPAGRVLGIDNSADMIALARESWCATTPNLEFRVQDARAIDAQDAFDVAFSNSAMHWVQDQAAVLAGVAQALKRGGRVVFSMGGRGTAALVYGAVAEMARTHDWSAFLAGVRSPHYFHGPEEYADWLAHAGLVARRIELVPRPMRLADLAALEGWIRTTGMHWTARIPENLRAEFLHEAATRVQAGCGFAEDGALLMPMVNLEVEARKP